LRFQRRMELPGEEKAKVRLTGKGFLTRTFGVFLDCKPHRKPKRLFSVRECESLLPLLVSVDTIEAVRRGDADDEAEPGEPDKSKG
jgi:hypothetical protein